MATHDEKAKGDEQYRMVKCSIHGCESNVVAKPAQLSGYIKLLLSLSLWTNMCIFEKHNANNANWLASGCPKHLRFLQFCGPHLSKEKQFLEQGKRAGKAEYLTGLVGDDPAKYLELFTEFACTHLVALSHICPMCSRSHVQLI